MRKLAVVGVDITHKFIYPALINGFDPALMERDGEWMADLFRGKPTAPLDPSVRVTAIASPDQAARDRIARVTDIPTVVDRVQDLPSDVDGVLVMEREGWRHLPLARPFLERGQFVYFDKPVTESRESWQMVRALAESRGATVMGGTALRYSSQVRAMLEALGRRPALSLTATGPGPWYDYACHTVEVLVMAYGTDVAAVEVVGEDRAGLAVLRWRSGAAATVQWGGYRGEFRFDAYDREEDGHRRFLVTDAWDYYYHLAQAIVSGAVGEYHQDLDQMGTVIAILDRVGSRLVLI